MRWPAVAGVLVLAALAWAGASLYAPRPHDLRAFQPDEVGRLETAMWRSYYEHERVRLFGELATLLRQQYGMSRLQSYLSGYRAARAAVVFQRGHDRSEYEQALPDLVAYYGAIRKMSVQRFDVERVARLELEWWIIHRERAQHAPGDLERSLADLQAALYALPAETFFAHARERAVAMLLRDERAEHGGVTEADWKQIDTELRASWTHLWHAVNGQTGS
jgi:hypothetical protein